MGSLGEAVSNWNEKMVLKRLGWFVEARMWLVEKKGFFPHLEFDDGYG